MRTSNVRRCIARIEGAAAKCRREGNEQKSHGLLLARDIMGEIITEEVTRRYNLRKARLNRKLSFGGEKSLDAGAEKS